MLFMAVTGWTMRRGRIPTPRSLKTSAVTLPLLGLGAGLTRHTSGAYRAARGAGAVRGTLRFGIRLTRTVHARPVVSRGRWWRSRWATSRGREGRRRGHCACLGLVSEPLMRLAVPVIEEPARTTKLL